MPVRRPMPMTILQKAMGPVLLIEDDGDTRELMTEFLGQAGYRVIASDEGRKAIELAGVTHPSLVLLDLRTGGMNGWQFLDRRRDEPALAHVPVVVVTGQPRAVPPGVAAVLTKPVSSDELLRTIQRVTRTSRRAVSST
jgi:CheY-like chemotaxis protein